MGSVRLYAFLAACFSFALLRTLASSEALPREMESSAIAPARAIWLGVRVCNRKLIVQEVFAGTPAATAGIEPSERIYSVNGESNVNDIRDDLNEIGLANAILVEVGHGGLTRELPILAAVRPTVDLRRDEAVYLPEATTTEVEPGSPYADIDCRKNCSAVVPECEPVLIQSQGIDRLYAKWRDKLVRYDGDFWGRVFTDRALCKKEVQEKCSFFL